MAELDEISRVQLYFNGHASAYKRTRSQELPARASLGVNYPVTSVNLYNLCYRYYIITIPNTVCQNWQTTLENNFDSGKLIYFCNKICTAFLLQYDQ